MAVDEDGTGPPDLLAGDLLGTDPDPCVPLPQDRPLPGIFLDENDRKLGGGPGDRPRPGDVDPLIPKQGEGESSMLVLPHVPHVHRPKAPPRERHKGGRHLPASLPRETGHPKLLSRDGVARDAAKVIDRVQADSHDVEHGIPLYPVEAAPSSGNSCEMSGR